MRESLQMTQTPIEDLQSRIQLLEEENRLLKERLEEAGISYDDIICDYSEAVDFYDPNQGERIVPFEVTDKIASHFL